MDSTNCSRSAGHSTGSRERAALFRCGRRTDVALGASFARATARLLTLRFFAEAAMLKFDSKTLDDLAARIGKAVEASPVKDVEKTIRAMLTSGLARLDVVPRAEFDTQAAVLAKTREKLEQLEARVAAMEGRHGD
jgi:BMFP domain-containing protein YqiC